jgi:hypothetical protein
MKRMLTLIVMVASVSLMASQGRMDVSGQKADIKLTPNMKSEGCALSNPGWIKDEIKKKQNIYFTTPKLEDEWQEFEFSFTPDKDGVVSISIRGQWHNKKKGEKPNYVYIKEVEVIEGATLKNGNFTEKGKKGNPTYWWFNQKGKELPVFEEKDGVTIVKVQFNNQLCQSISVKKGKQVKVKVKIKSAMPKAAK